jgi:hypothetical protein
MLVDAEGNKTRVGTRIEGDNKVRFSKVSGNTIPRRRSKKRIRVSGKDLKHSVTKVHPTNRYTGRSPTPEPWRKRREQSWQHDSKRSTTTRSPAIAKELGITNAMAIPKLEKIVINMGLGEATQNVKIMDPLVADLAPSPDRSR